MSLERHSLSFSEPHADYWTDLPLRSFPSWKTWLHDVFPADSSIHGFASRFALLTEA
ncbi:hypothetical protein [Leptospira noguchii]|uniref:hypothetical protein n=1 Tax=Leptospira noguchii TaxID=28182 RepID=UPI0015EF54E6|nr:hypothetical protein [Leptospira noguchii]UOG31902.1 hypothetical protein MAL06_07970 [Leptospira noguchii]UOG51307.1 hypothetical protein MAL09_11275 [Leptospira noguchii]